jgi:hypothetical protein
VIGSVGPTREGLLGSLAIDNENQRLLGHNDVRTAMINTHVLNRDGRGGRSPADLPARRLGERSTETAYHARGAVTTEQPRAGELGR